MRNGQPVHSGAVAVNNSRWKVLRGTVWRVVEGPDNLRGREFTVEDSGSQAQFDIWTPNCQEASFYANWTLTVEEVK